MDQVSLMERVDDKYTISYNDLKNILENISSEYFCLEIKGERSFTYHTEYFDTIDNTFLKIIKMEN